MLHLLVSDDVGIIYEESGDGRRKRKKLSSSSTTRRLVDLMDQESTDGRLELRDFDPKLRCVSLPLISECSSTVTK